VKVLTGHKALSRYTQPLQLWWMIDTPLPKHKTCDAHRIGPEPCARRRFLINRTPLWQVKVLTGHKALNRLHAAAPAVVDALYQGIETCDAHRETAHKPVRGTDS
jgi:hypothetical protein